MTALDFAAVAAGAFFLGFVLGTALGRASARRCAHVFHGTPELVRWKYVRRCELCGAAEVSTSPIPQPGPERRAGINPPPTYPRPPAPPAPPPRRP